MRGLKHIIVWTLVLIAGIKTGVAQLDPLYNQYLFNQSMINPAYTGIHDVLNATAISRYQWAGIEGAPKTNSLNISTSLLDNKAGVGVFLVNDNYGISNNTEIQLLYSYRIEFIGAGKLSFGLQTGLINYTYDYNKLNLEYVDDPEVLGAQTNISYKNFGTGVFYMDDNYYVGISVPRILNTNIKDGGGAESTRYRRHFYLSAGMLIDHWLSIKFKPSVLVKYVDGHAASFDLNAQLLFKEVLWAGVTLRDFNNGGLTGQFEINDRLRLGYTFEIPLNPLNARGFGTHELMISFDLEIFENHAIGRRYF